MMAGVIYHGSRLERLPWQSYLTFAELIAPCLSNFFAEYLKQYASMDDSQTGVKIARKVLAASDMQMIRL